MSEDIKIETMYAEVSWWAVDFCRAMYERPKIIRLLIRLLMGKHAYKEFYGLLWKSDYHFGVINGYDCKDTNYNMKLRPDYNDAVKYGIDQ